MKSNLRIVFMGTPEFAAHSLRLVVESGYNVVGVITAPDRPSGRGQKINYSSVKEYAVKKGLHLMQPTNLKDTTFIEELKALNADIQVVVAFRMLPEVIWNMPSKGTLNLHASLLPKYRGAAPINWAIINGEKESGVTTFFIEKEIDTGNIILQEKVNIEENENAGHLHDKLMEVGGQLVCETIDKISSGKIEGTAQEGKATKAPKIFKKDCKINWSDSIENIHNFIRGLSPYPTAWTFVDEEQKQNIKVFKSSIQKTSHSESNGKIITDGKSELKVAVHGGFIQLHEIQLSGKKKMKTEDFLRGYRFAEDIILK
jgi:methionyl-tRNA formyltransferase